MEWEEKSDYVSWYDIIYMYMSAKVNCKRNRVNKKVKFCKCVYTSCPLLILSLGIGLLNYLFYTLDHPLSDFLSLHSSPSVAFFKCHIFFFKIKKCKNGQSIKQTSSTITITIICFIKQGSCFILI